MGNSEAVIQTSDLETFNILLQKVAINSAMIGSKSHIEGDTPSAKDIVKGSMEEVTLKDVKTAKEGGVTVKPSTPKQSNLDPWGPDDWD